MTHDSDRFGRQPDLLPGLAQGGGLRIGVGGVDRSTGKRDLAGVRAEVPVTNRERDHQAIVSGIQHQQRGRRARGWEAGAVEPAPRDLPITRAWQETLVEGNGAGSARQCIGDGVLPSGPSA